MIENFLQIWDTIKAKTKNTKTPPPAKNNTAKNLLKIKEKVYPFVYNLSMQFYKNLPKRVNKRIRKQDSTRETGNETLIIIVSVMTSTREIIPIISQFDWGWYTDSVSAEG